MANSKSASCQRAAYDNNERIQASPVAQALGTLRKNGILRKYCREEMAGRA